MYEFRVSIRVMFCPDLGDILHTTMFLDKNDSFEATSKALDYARWRYPGAKLKFQEIQLVSANPGPGPDPLTLTRLAAEKCESQVELKGIIVNALEIADARTDDHNFHAVASLVSDKLIVGEDSKPGDKRLSPETQRVLSDMLRGVIKGYGVRLDELDIFNFDLEQKEKVVRELHALSDDSVDLDLIIYHTV